MGVTDCTMRNLVVFGLLTSVSLIFGQTVTLPQVKDQYLNTLLQEAEVIQLLNKYINADGVTDDFEERLDAFRSKVEKLDKRAQLYYRPSYGGALEKLPFFGGFGGPGFPQFRKREDAPAVKQFLGRNEVKAFLNKYLFSRTDDDGLVDIDKRVADQSDHGYMGGMGSILGN